MLRMTALLAIPCWLVLFPVSASAQQEIKLAYAAEPGSLFDRAAREFAKRVNARLGDKAKVTVYSSSQLGGDFEQMKKLKLGTIDLALPSTVMSSYSSLFGLFELPYLVKNRTHMARIRDEIVMPVMAPAVAKEGYKIVAVWENGFRHITNNKRPIVKPEDLQGINLRIPQGRWRMKMFQAYGANATPLAFSEVYLALQTGALDGQENPLAQIYPGRLHEVQKFLSLSSHVYTPAYLTAGRSWDNFDSEVQKAVLEVAKEMQPEVEKMAADLDREFLSRLRDSGMQINEIDKKAFVQASERVYQEFYTEVPEGKMLVDKAVALGNTP